VGKKITHYPTPWGIEPKLPEHIWQTCLKLQQNPTRLWLKTAQMMTWTTHLTWTQCQTLLMAMTGSMRKNLPKNLKTFTLLLMRMSLACPLEEDSESEGSEFDEADITDDATLLTFANVLQLAQEAGLEAEQKAHESTKCQKCYKGNSERSL